MFAMRYAYTFATITHNPQATTVSYSCFFLFHQALGFPHGDGDYSYLWKCSMIVAGLYLFFVLESLMKLFIEKKVRYHNIIIIYSMFCCDRAFKLRQIA